jgi:hypothetical protein
MPVPLVKESIAVAREAREPQAAQAIAYADPGNLAITLDVPRLQTLWDGDDAIQKLVPDLELEVWLLVLHFELGYKGSQLRGRALELLAGDDHP